MSCELALHGLQQFFVAESEHGFVASAAEEAAQDAFAFGCTMRKFVVDEGAGQHARAFTAGDEKSEARRQLCQLLFVVAERHRHRRAVGDAEKVVRQLMIDAVEQLARNIRRQSRG